MGTVGDVVVANVYAFIEPSIGRIAASLVDDPDAVVQEAKERFAEIAPTLAYLDEPQHPMALSMFSCAACLAGYLPLRDRGADVHAFGRGVHGEFATMALPTEAAGLQVELIEAAARSQEDARPGEFVFDVTGEPGGTSWAMNIRSCGICSLFSRFDAMDLVPYMCALDDLFSDRFEQGLRRTGTIALGASHCDFRYDGEGQSLRLVEQYPTRVQLRTTT